jgi:hypothetical protein
MLRHINFLADSALDVTKVGLLERPSVKAISTLILFRLLLPSERGEGRELDRSSPLRERVREEKLHETRMMGLPQRLRTFPT